MTAADPIVLEPGSPEWLREMTGSKVAAVLGLSPWQSRYSLWFEMKGAVEHAGPTKQMTRGHYLEDAVVRWVADQHSLPHVAPGQAWRNRARPWQVASPDRLVLPWEHAAVERLQAVMEVKTDARGDFRWGPDGSDEVPLHVRCQGIWQCDVLGVDTCYVGALLPYLDLRSYVIHPADGEIEFMREECLGFLESLANDEPPDVDQHDATYQTIRVLNPSIEDVEVHLGLDLSRDYARSVLSLRIAEDEYNLRRSQVADRMGSARWAVFGDPQDPQRLADRRPAPKTKVPYVNVTNSPKRLTAAAEQEEPDADDE